MRRCDSAAIVSNTSEDLPDPLTPVKTVRRRFGISTLMFLRLFSRAPTTRMTSWANRRREGLVVAAFWVATDIVFLRLFRLVNTLPCITDSVSATPSSAKGPDLLRLACSSSRSGPFGMGGPGATS